MLAVLIGVALKNWTWDSCLVNLCLEKDNIYTEAFLAYFILIYTTIENCILSMFLFMRIQHKFFKEWMNLMWIVGKCAVILNLCILGFLKTRYSYISVKIISFLKELRGSPLYFLFLLSLYFSMALVPFCKTWVWDIMLHCKIKTVAKWSLEICTVIMFAECRQSSLKSAVLKAFTFITCF